LFRDDSYGKEKKKKEGNKKRLEISITVGWLRRPRIESMALWRESFSKCAPLWKEARGRGKGSDAFVRQVNLNHLRHRS